MSMPLGIPIDSQLKSPGCRHPKIHAVAGTVFILAIAVRFPLLPYPGFIPDQTQFVMWSQQAATGGLASLYEANPQGRPLCNYPPAYPLILRGLAAGYRHVVGAELTPAVYRDIYNRDWNDASLTAVWLYKTPAVLADAVLAALLLYWIGARASIRQAGIVAMIYALSPAVVYDSAVWGQVDSIPILFTIASLEMARRRRLIAMGVLASLAILTKAQMIVFAPIWAVALLQMGRVNPLRIVASLLAIAVTCAIVVAPFASSLDGMTAAYTRATSYYPYLHLNGFSAWFLANPLTQPMLGAMQSLYARDDAAIGSSGLDARLIGFFGFALVAVSVLVRLLRHGSDDAALRYASRVLPLAFFVLSTQMHERYAMPALAAWAWAYQPTRGWWTAWLVLAASISINVLWAWPGPDQAFWTGTMQQLLWRSWLGLRPGVIAALGMIVILVVSITGWNEPNRHNLPSR